MLWIIVTVVLLALVYYLIAVKPYKYWIERHVLQAPTVPIFGNIWHNFIQKESFTELIERIYNLFPNNRYSGMYLFSVPFLIVRDPDLLKQITIKDFDHFLNHRTFLPESSDQLWSKNLFALKDQKWRDMRSTLSPAFTSSKMKQMFVLISESAEQFAQYFLDRKENTITIEMKDTFTRFANDVIASTAFGIKCDSLAERNNEFYRMGKEATDFKSFWKNLKFFVYLIAPWLYKVVNFSMFSKAVSDFFKNLVSDNIASREKRGIIRPDLIHLLMEARKNGLKHEENESKGDAGFATVEESEFGKKAASHKMELTDIDITAQALIFFFAGFDTVSTAMCFTSYELAVNPDVQKRLTQEVDEAHQKCNGKLTYEILLSMKYLDMVVCESLRKWPPAVIMDRICTKPYIIQPQSPDEAPLHLEKNWMLLVPVYGIHRDAKYYPEPERFDPERFNEENKDKILPFTYMPFGIGPRNCIGSRFALLEIKALYFHILSHFEIVPVEKTQIPLVICRKQFNLMGEGGIWLGFKRRQDKI